MGVIAALRSGDRIYLATDAGKVRSDLYWRTKSEFNLKIHKLKNGVIIGALGSLNVTQKLYLNENWFKPPKGAAFDKKFLVTSVVPKYIELLRDMNLLTEPESAKDEYPNAECYFIIVSGDDAFIIDNNFGVYIIKDFAIIYDLNNCDLAESVAYVTDRSDPERFMVTLFEKLSETVKDIVPVCAVIDTKNTEFRYYGGQV